MASVETQPARGDARAAITTVAAQDPVAIERRPAKRSRKGDLVLSEEADTCGWSSAVAERSVALRRRRCSSAPFWSRRGLVSVAVEEAAADVAVAAEPCVQVGGMEFFYVSVL